MGKVNVKYNLKKFIALAGTVLILTTTTACSKKVDCAIDTYHAHKYVDNNGYVRYIAQEWEEYEGYQRQEEYVILKEEDKKAEKFIDDKDLLRIRDNEEAIKKAQEENQPFVEYRYSYTYLMPIPHYHRIGKVSTVTYTFVPRTHYSWTRDPNHTRLTGETRLCKYEYTSYKIEIDERGNYVLIPGPEHEDILSTKEEYPYIKKTYYRVINVENGNELEYEDMETDDVERIQEETEETKETGKALVRRL